METSHGKPSGPPPKSILPDVPSNTILCTWGQNIVQDIVARTTDMFLLLKASGPTTGNKLLTQKLEEKKKKVADHMRIIAIMFQKLKVVYDQVAKQSTQYEYITVDNFIPYKEGTESGNGRSMINESQEPCETLIIIRNEFAATIREKNELLKMVINKLRNLSLDIDTMLAMKKH